MRKFIDLLGILFAFFMILGAKCEGSAPTNDLNAPKGLRCEQATDDWRTTCTGLTSPIKIRFYAYNNEGGFSGFNIYVVQVASITVDAFYSTYVYPHYEGDAEDVSYRQYIFASTYGENPSLQGSSYQPDINNKVILIEYDQISADGDGDALSGDYYIGVTAVDTNNGVESYVSNIVKVTL